MAEARFEVTGEAIDGALGSYFRGAPLAQVWAYLTCLERHPTRARAELQDPSAAGEGLGVVAEVLQEGQRRGPHSAAAVVRLEGEGERGVRRHEVPTSRGFVGRRGGRMGKLPVGKGV